MKITATQYAQVLYNITENKSQSEIETAVKTFFEFVKKNNQVKLSGEIMKKFQNIWNEKNETIEAQIESQYELDAKTEEKVGKFIQEKYSAKKVILNKNINEEILGGIIIRVGDEVLDGSLRKNLSNLKNNLSN